MPLPSKIREESDQAENQRIAYVNVAAQSRALKKELLTAIERVMEHGQFVLGPEVEAFEKQLATLCGVQYAVTVNSGTDALILSLRALGIGAGDEVITVPNSFVATSSAIVLVGAKPVFVDVDDSYTIDTRQIEAAITARTKAILPVHLTGRPADMKPILSIAQKHGLAVIEDAAQAIFAEYFNRPIGSWGSVGCFSFHPLKTLNACGDGGAVTTNDRSLYEKLLLLRNLGLRTRENCLEWSGNSRLDSIQAAMLMVKLRYVQQWTEARRDHAKFYQEALGRISQVRVPVDKPYEKAAYHTFVIQAGRRDELRQYLLQQGIETAIHYPIPIHLQEAARSLGYERGSFPITERQADTILSLPIYPELTPASRQRIVEAIRMFYSKNL